MVILELLPWVVGIALLGAMALLASIHFRGGEFAGRPTIVMPAVPRETGHEGTDATEG